MKIKSLAVVAVFVIAMFCFAGFANAQTAQTQTQLTQQLIQLLTQMITQLEQEIQQILSQQHTTTTMSCSTSGDCQEGYYCNNSQCALIVPDNSPKVITVVSPNGGETWQMGTNQVIKISVSSNMPLSGTCVDAYAVDVNGNKTPLGLGSYIGSASRTGIGFQLGIGDSANIQPGQYKVELDAHFCAETNNTFITSTTSSGYVNITANPNFIKPTITQISPNQAGRNTTITISGSNLSGVVGLDFSQNGQMLADEAVQSIISKDQNHVTFSLYTIFSNLANPVGTYQVSVNSWTGESNSLSLTLTSK